MGDKAAKPSISFSTRIDLNTDKKLRRLQRRHKFRLPELMRRAVEALESVLADDRKGQPAP